MAPKNLKMKTTTVWLHAEQDKEIRKLAKFLSKNGRKTSIAELVRLGIDFALEKHGMKR